MFSPLKLSPNWWSLAPRERMGWPWKAVSCQPNCELLPIWKMRHMGQPQGTSKGVFRTVHQKWFQLTKEYWAIIQKKNAEDELQLFLESSSTSGAQTRELLAGRWWPVAINWRQGLQLGSRKGQLERELCSSPISGNSVDFNQIATSSFF